MKTTFVLSLSIILLFFACKPDKKPDISKIKIPEPITIKPFSASMDSLVKQGGGPCESDFDCMKIRAVWPVVQNGNEKVQKIINDSINRYILEHLDFGPNGNDQALVEAMDNLIHSYKREYEESEAFGLGWAMDVEAKISFHDEIANLEIFNYAFMGGAHPNTYSQYTNFNTKTGAVIEYSDFVKDTTAFKKLMNDKFIENLYDGIEMEDLFWGEGFQIAQNFKLEKDSIEILYNPYEAAPYAFGSFSFKISNKELEGIVK